MSDFEQKALDKLDALIADFRILRHEMLRLRDRVAALESAPPPDEAANDR